MFFFITPNLLLVFSIQNQPVSFSITRCVHIRKHYNEQSLSIYYLKINQSK